MATENKIKDVKVMEIETAVSFYIQKGAKSKDEIVEKILRYFDVTKEDIEKSFSEVEKKFPNWQN